MRRVLWLFAASVMVTGSVAAQSIITTVAGIGSCFCCVDVGDGGPATHACLSVPLGVAVDTTGNLFIADANLQIRKVDVTGTISTVAGGGGTGCIRDGWLAVEACVSLPRGVAVDAVGRLFIADTNHNRIRIVDTAGRISTVAGKGKASFTGGRFCGDGGPARDACLHRPYGVTVDTAGNVFIADERNHHVRKVDWRGTITTVAGHDDPLHPHHPQPGFCGDGGPATSACLNSPSDVAVDASGNLFIADVANNRIRKVDAATGIMTTVAGSGAAGYCGDGVPATSACLNRPAGVTLDASGNVFVADAANNRIRKVDAATGIMTTVAGNGTAGYCGDGVPATSACLNRPARVTLDAAGNLFIADTLNRRIRKVEASPDVLGALRLYDTLLSGCIKTNGTVTLTEPAPVGGLTIVLHSDNPNVVVPASFTVWEGMRSGRFQIVTSPVAARETATIFASVSGQVLAATLTLKPMVLKDLTLAPNPVVGGNPSGGTMTLQCPAAPGDIEVTLASSNPSVANPTVSHITIPFGTQVMTFDLATTPVTRVYTPAVSATANGVKRSRPLTVNPVP